MRESKGVRALVKMCLTQSIIVGYWSNVHYVAEGRLRARALGGVARRRHLGGRRR